jgi:hypothetical protein
MFNPFIKEEIIEEVIEEEIGFSRRRPGYSGFAPGYGYGGGIGFDVTDGDPVENFGNGFGVDLVTGQPEFDLGFGDIDEPF